MSENVSQDELKERVLLALYKHAQVGDRAITAQEIGALVDGTFGVQRIHLALESLTEFGLIRGSHSMNSPSRYRISRDGYERVEEVFFERLEQAEEASADPLRSIEAKLSPAADRMVSFADNQSEKDQAVQAVDDAIEAIRSSNTLNEDLRNESISSISTWKDMLLKSRPFAIGAFRFLVWDRIKSVIEGGIEDAYRFALVALLISLGTIVSGLL